jgi:hypothetical protein
LLDVSDSKTVSALSADARAHDLGKGTSTCPEPSNLVSRRLLGPVIAASLVGPSARMVQHAAKPLHYDSVAPLDMQQGKNHLATWTFRVPCEPSHEPCRAVPAAVGRGVRGAGAELGRSAGSMSPSAIALPAHTAASIAGSPAAIPMGGRGVPAGGRATAPPSLTSSAGNGLVLTRSDGQVGYAARRSCARQPPTRSGSCRQSTSAGAARCTSPRSSR